MYAPTLPMNIPRVNTNQPMATPGIPGAQPSSPQGLLPSQIAQQNSRATLGCSSCTGVPQFRDIAPKTWPAWAKVGTAVGVVGILTTIIVMASRR